MIETPPSQDDKTLAVITHASGILFHFIVPLVVWLVSKDTKPWLTAQAKEALNFQITVAIGYLIAGVASTLLIGFLLFPIIWAANIIFCIVAAVQTSQGVDYKYPVALRLIK